MGYADCRLMIAALFAAICRQLVDRLRWWQFGSDEKPEFPVFYIVDKICACHWIQAAIVGKFELHQDIRNRMQTTGRLSLPIQCLTGCDYDDGRMSLVYGTSSVYETEQVYSQV